MCVFAKPPVPGKVKTRLAATLGDARAAELARAFLEDTWALASGLSWARAVVATTGGGDSNLGLSPDVERWDQGEGDLGQRLERVLRRALVDAEVAIAIGADSPGLPPRLLLEASRALESSSAVLGPSDDGGFYLLGLRRCPSQLLEGLPWSQPSTCAATRARLEERGLSPRLLEPWFDVDQAGDLERLRGLLAQAAVSAPATARLLGVGIAAPGATRCG